MRKMLCLCLIAILLSGCGAGAEPTTVPATTVPVTTVPATTAPVHSALYLPEYTVEQIIEYFNEVVLAMEYSDGTGDSSLVRKWCAPIRYRIAGEPTEEDLAVLEAFFVQLNAVPGFPGMYPAPEDEFSEVTLSFLDEDSFSDAFFDLLGGESAFGAVQFWYYTDTCELYTADIGYRTDVDQAARDSILVEEIVNMLGISDTELREDSIVYQYSDDNLTLSDVDWVILKLLYDPAIRPAMTQEECEAVIRELYY